MISMRPTRTTEPSLIQYRRGAEAGLRRELPRRRRNVGSGDDRRGQRVIRELLDRGGDLDQRTVARRRPRDLEPPERHRPGLVERDERRLPAGLERGAVSHEHALAAVAPSATLMASGVASPSAHGHATTSTATAVMSACDARRPASTQPTPVTNGKRDHADREVERGLVGEPLGRRALLERVLDERTDARQPRESTSRSTVGGERAVRQAGSRPRSCRRPPLRPAADSPVSSDSSACAAPSITSASTGTRSPGLTTMVCPGRTCHDGVASSTPSPERTHARSGCSSMRPRTSLRARAPPAISM